MWNANAGVGVDISIFTLETGASFGLSNVFSDDVPLDEDVKHFTWYLTAGIVLGGGGGE